MTTLRHGGGGDDIGPEIVSNYSCGCCSCSDYTYDVIITDDVNILEVKGISNRTLSKFGGEKYS